MKTQNPALSNDVDLFPGAQIRWGLGYMLNMQPGPNGRSAGTVSWGGIFNTYYWIDPVEARDRADHDADPALRRHARAEALRAVRARRLRGAEERAMKFGVWIPNCRHLATPEIIRGTAVRAEQLGYDSVWVSDHVVVPHANVKNFGETIFDPLVTLGVVAGATRRCSSVPRFSSFPTATRSSPPR